MKNIYKLFFCFLLLFIFNFNYVKAETITLEQVTNKLKEIVALENTTENSLSVETDSDNLALKTNDGFSMVFDFENDILSTTHLLEDNIEDYLNETFRYASGIALVMKALIELHNYTERDWNLFNNLETATLEENGYEYILINDSEMKFSANINKIKLNLAYIDAPKPTLIFEDITENSVSISAEADVEEGTMIEIYRSTDGENYEWKGTISVKNENSQLSIIDDELESGKTYYYKATVEKSNNFSDAKTITTLSTKVNEDKEENDNNAPVDEDYTDKPADQVQTGLYDPLIICITLLVLALLTIKQINKKKRFNQI